VGASFLLAAGALKTPARNGYHAQGVNLNVCVPFGRQVTCGYNAVTAVMSNKAFAKHCIPYTQVRIYVYVCI